MEFKKYSKTFHLIVTVFLLDKYSNNQRKLEEKQEKVRVPSYVPGTENTVGYKVDSPVLVGLPAVFLYKKEGCVCDRHKVSAGSAQGPTPLSYLTSIIRWCQ